ncbi:MAG: DASH family cryptochrome, partial [Chloroherpetonaceae bacterium]|nr:DASH family cryptochrome [Chloroherpetonaceae bacterium]MDW8437349.1 DASH family cryptochrome [Chloroherpetonaceae bacterium]
MPHSTVLVWFRNDLRLRDNETLTRAIESSRVVVPVYVFDERWFGATRFGFKKTGAFRAKFLLETVADLKRNLQRLGSDLAIRVGKPERLLVELARDLRADAVFFSEESTDEELAVERELKRALTAQGIAHRSFWQTTLYRKEDLPFSVERLPDVFTTFRKQAEKFAKVRSTFPAPTRLNPLPPIDLGKLPTLAELGLDEPPSDARAVLRFKGGESEAWKRLDEYVWQTDSLKRYKETRNGLLGANYSSKLSPWLANGAISPRAIFEEVKRYEQERVSNESTYWLVFELLWRDYFRFLSLKCGNRIFKKRGIKNQPVDLRQDEATFRAWAEGRTGVPFIDANMRELSATGFMSNRGRQNVASFLVKDLKIDWRMGAEWFESLLIDYDVASNYGNWNYVAGVGNDPREDRYFNPIRQATMYDPNGDYVRHWIPELKCVPAPLIHEPSKLSPMEQTLYGARIG